MSQDDKEILQQVLRELEKISHYTQEVASLASRPVVVPEGARVVWPDDLIDEAGDPPSFRQQRRVS